MRIERLDDDRETWQVEVLPGRKAIIWTAHKAAELGRKESRTKTYL